MKHIFQIWMLIGGMVFTSGCTENFAPTGVIADTKIPVQSNIKSEVIKTGKIIKLQEDMMLVAETGDSSGLYQVPVNAPTDTPAFSVGDLVEVGFSGMILEIYPAIIANPDYVRLLEKGEDFVGLYAEVLMDLFQTDPALNDQIQFIALNLTEEANLTLGEKNALLYLLWNETQIETRLATYDDLLAESLISVDEASGFSMLDHGILFHLSAEKAEKNKFKFSADKWRSSLGAYYFYDCTAKKENGTWGYTIGAEMIS